MKSELINLLEKIDSLVVSGKSLNVILINVCSLLKSEVYHYDWVGFYVLDNQKLNLVLGPYCGKPTDHTIIPVGKGVCGQVAQSNELKIVQDVTLEGNYIACSLDVLSEIVVPVLKDDRFIAEIDIDSHSPAPFTNDDVEFLTTVCQKLSVLF